VTRRLLSLVLAMGLAGCVGVEGFDPVGSVAAITGSWQIDSSPATDETCDALGASRVRITFLDGLRAVPHSSLFAACNEGALDSRMGSGAVVAAGLWTVRLDALDGDGSILASGPTAEMNTDAPDGGVGVPVITVPAANFFTATLSSAFTIGGEAPSNGSCEAAGIERVGFVFDELAPVGEGEEAPGYADTEAELCEVGVVGTRLRPGFTYTVRLRAYAEGGGRVRDSAEQTLDVAATTTDVRFDADGPMELGP